MKTPNPYATIHPYHVANIVATYKSTSIQSRLAGYDWYSVTGEYVCSLGYQYGLTREQSAAIFATISPQKSIDRNHAIYADYISGADIWELTGAQVVKCDAIRDNANLASINSWVRGPKVRAFYANLLGNWDIPTIDRHAVSNVLGYPLSKVATDRQLDYARRVLIECAQLIGIEVAPLQAIIWQAWRNQFGHLGDTDTMFVANWQVRPISYYPSVLFN